MPKGRLEYLKRLLPFLQNQSEDCLYLNVFSPLHGKCIADWICANVLYNIYCNSHLKLYVGQIAETILIYMGIFYIVLQLTGRQSMNLLNAF